MRGEGKIRERGKGEREGGKGREREGKGREREGKGERGREREREVGGAVNTHA